MVIIASTAVISLRLKIWRDDYNPTSTFRRRGFLEYEENTPLLLASTASNNSV
jgi:hypothetical protein